MIIIRFYISAHDTESSEFRYGFKRSAGRIYIYGENSYYWPVCDIHWDLKDANVTCRQLGYPGAVRATRRSYFHRDSSNQQLQALLSNIDCAGSEASIYDCPDVFGNPITLSTQPCSSQSIAGVICDG